MAKINLDIGHALSREDQRQNRRQPYFISQSPASYSFSGNHAAKFSKKLVLTIFRLLERWTSQRFAKRGRRVVLRRHRLRLSGERGRLARCVTRLAGRKWGSFRRRRPRSPANGSLIR